MNTVDLIQKSRDGGVLCRSELTYLLNLPVIGEDTYRVMAEAARVSKEVSGGRAEVHAQFAVNLAPCPCECLFCSFAKINGVFKSSTELTPEQAVAHARQFETDGANAVYLMTTATYPFGRFLEMATEVRARLKSETILIANVGDQNPKDAMRLRDAGFAGVYHAIRLREGKDTALSPEKRKQSIQNFQAAGLSVGTCVEPVGPEHTNEELADMIKFTASFNPAFSGAARRIAIPGTKIAERGTISEMRMAQIVAVTRLGMPRSVMGNCTHEPCTLGAIAGANLFWAEAGANPRDIKEKTEEGRGESVVSCGTLFRESAWEVWEGPSRYFQS
jgi:biotin synthase